MFTTVSATQAVDVSSFGKKNKFIAQNEAFDRFAFLSVLIVNIAEFIQMNDPTNADFVIKDSV